MALRCAQCGNQERFEARRPGVLRFAVYRDATRGGELRDEREYVCRVCGSTRVTEQ